MITDYFPKKPGMTAKELGAWKALRQLAGKTTTDILQQQTVSVIGQRPGMTQTERQALHGLYLLGKTTPKQAATKTLIRTHGKEGWNKFPEQRKERLIATELTRRHKENEKRFMDKLNTLRRMRETRLKKELDSLRDSPVRMTLAQPQPTMTVQQLGQRLRRLRQKKTPTPPKEKPTKKKEGTRRSPRLEGVNEKFKQFHEDLQKRLAIYKEKLEKSGRFTPEEIQLGLERMEADAMNGFYTSILTQLDEELFTARLGKLLGLTKKAMEKRYEIFLREGHLPEIVSKKRKRTTATKKKIADDDSDDDGDDGGDLPEPVRKRRQPIAM